MRSALPVRRGTALFVSVSAMALTLVAASSAGSGGLAEAVKKTEGEPTGQESWAVSAIQGNQSQVVYRSALKFDNPRKLLDATVDFRTFAAQDPSALQVGKVADWRFEIVVDNSRSPVFYMTSPLFKESSFQSKLPRSDRNRPWIKLDFAELRRTHPSGLAKQFSALLPGLSPVAFLGALSGPASTKGSESVGGIRMTRYETTANLAQHASGLPTVLVKLIKVAGPNWRVGAWVDGDSLIRRVEFTSPPIKSQGNGQVRLTCDLSQLGSRMKISIPKPNQVFDAATLGP